MTDPKPTVKPQILKGFRDYLPEQMILRRHVIETARRVFERHGFEPIDTPVLEYYEILTGKAGENEKLMYNFEDQGERRVGMRYDLTVPLARMAAMHQNEMVLPFKRYHIAPVWRAEKPQRGRFREFWQCDADIVGSSSMAADAEVVSIAAEVLTELGLPNFLIHISHRRLLERIALSAGIDTDQAATVYRLVDKLDKIGRDKVIAEMVEQGIEEDAAIRMLDVIQTGFTDPLEMLDRLANDLKDDAVATSAIEELRELFGLLPTWGVDPQRYVLDLTLARGLDYYTGPVYEATVEEPKIGSVSGAGRYDGLIGQFLGREIPATGISLGLERLIEVVKELDLVPARSSVADAMMVAIPATGFRSGELVRQLRDKGLNIDQSLLTNRGIGDQLKYADRRGIPLAIIPGEEELEQGQVAVKDLASGEQITVKTEDLALTLRSMLGNQEELA